ncbi:MAG: efflux RND transporter periplasmic adaptor subunit, partial [candidate division KSB1 bacterium]|nr:efflux RND transporter periplasmic adaptor subunit [candidate division KSB1 bacterium]
ENTRTQYRVAKANWDAVQQSVLVRAPISGTITSINVQESDNVQPGDALFTISQTGRLKTRLWLTENERRDIHPGDRAEARWNDAVIQGSVTQVDLSLNTQNQAFGATVEFDNPGNSVISGVNGEITIFSDTETDAYIVERKNVIEKGDSYYVFTVNKDRAVLTPIVTGREFGLDLEVTSGVSEGDSLITEGQLMLEGGDLVNIVAGAE